MFRNRWNVSLIVLPVLIAAALACNAGAASPDDAVEVLFGKQLAQQEDGERRKQELIAEFRDKIGILPAAEAALVDDVIDPADTRRVLIQALDLARERRAGHPFKRRGITPI